jgi:para-nitrobenzyl esterase
LYRSGLFNRMPMIIGTVGDEGWPFVDRSFLTGLDALQYEMTVRSEFGIEADRVLATYPAGTFPSPKDALSRLAGDVEFVCEARRVARALSADGAPVYAYSFQHIIDAVTPGRSFHGLESNLLFGNNFAAPSNHVLNATDTAVFAAMSSYWRQFMETGSPNASGTPVPWPLFRPLQSSGAIDPALSDRYLVLDRTISETSYLRDSQCNFWESFNFRSVLGAIPAAAR